MDNEEVRMMADGYLSSMVHGKADSLSEARVANLARWALVGARIIVEATPLETEGHLPPGRAPDWVHP